MVTLSDLQAAVRILDSRYAAAIAVTLSSLSMGLAHHLYTSAKIPSANRGVAVVVIVLLGIVCTLAVYLRPVLALLIGPIYLTTIHALISVWFEEHESNRWIVSVVQRCFVGIALVQGAVLTLGGIMILGEKSDLGTADVISGAISLRVALYVRDTRGASDDEGSRN